MPGRKFLQKCFIADLNLIFTGTRCTTFTKLPVALSGGNNEPFAPVIGEKL